MKIKKISSDWYIGTSGNLTFFARTRSEIWRKVWAHRSERMDQNYRIADKLIKLDESYREAKA